jgi:hypothetical protein
MQLRDTVLAAAGILLIAALGCQAAEKKEGSNAIMKSYPDRFTVWQPGVYHRFQKEEAIVVEGPDSLAAVACRNESVPFQLAAVKKGGGADLRAVCSALENGGNTMDASAWKVFYADYVDTAEKGLVSDILTEEKVRDLPDDRIQPIWLRLDVPPAAAPGRYAGTVEVRLGEKESASFKVTVEVLDALLPSPHEDHFYLDLWQHPGAIARYHEVKLWSEAHWALIRDYTRLLAEAGQNPITACIMHDPWASQTFDPHESMVEWVRQADGSFAFDFSVLERYVKLCFEEGLTGPINCYSLAMGPGGRRDCPIRYWDEAEGCYAKLDSAVGDAAWKSVWKQFFTVFIPWLKERNWLTKTCIAMDEAPEDKMAAVMQAIPGEFRIALAGNYHEELRDRVYDYCIIYPGPKREFSARRRANGMITTFYTCCGPEYPNTFTFSPLIESRILPWNALNAGCDGYLRWAFASWPEDPLKSSVWGSWPSGDTFLVYPGPRTSIRFELFKKGIQDFGAYRLALEKAPDDTRLAEALAEANAEHDGRKSDASALDAARELINDILAENKR